MRGILKMLVTSGNEDNKGYGNENAIGFSDFDVRLLYGLTFCRKFCALFDQIKDSAGGMERLRLLKTKLEKRVVEGLIPIAKFV